MQEEVEMRTITLIINGGKFTGRVLKRAVERALAYMLKQQSEYIRPHGKQSVRQLARQNQGMSNIEISDPDIRRFEHIARKYGVDFAVKKVKSKGNKPRYLVFFRTRDADALTAAFTEYTERRISRDERPSVLEKMREIGERLASMSPVKEHRKELSR